MVDDPAEDTADAGIDKISELPDDILLDILGRQFTAGDVRTAARTSILSCRWRHLPWPEISCCILYRTVILQLVFFSCSVSQLENKERVSCRSRAPARARRVMGMLPGSFSLHVDARRRTYLARGMARAGRRSWPRSHLVLPT